MALLCKALAWTTLSDTLQLHYGIRTRITPPLYGGDGGIEAGSGSGESNGEGGGAVSADSWLRSHFKALMLADTSVILAVIDHLFTSDHDTGGKGSAGGDVVIDKAWRSVVVAATGMLTLSVVCVDDRATHKAASEVPQRRPSKIRTGPQITIFSVN